MSEEILTRWQDPTIAEQQKEIEKLNKCIKDDKENADEIMAEQQREIERLHKENKELIELYQRTCTHLFNIGNDELARYFQAQINECNTFTTQGSDKE